MPGGRAILGGLLVAAAVVGLFCASTRTNAGPKQSWVVARHALPPGARLAVSDLRVVSIDLPPEVTVRSSNPDELVGATVIAPLTAGDLVQASVVVAKPSGPTSREVTFGVSRAAIGESLEQGERIDVVATYRSGNDAYSTVVLRQALVVTLDRGRNASRPTPPSPLPSTRRPTPSRWRTPSRVAKLTIVRATGATPIPVGSSSFRQSNAPTGRP